MVPINTILNISTKQFADYTFLSTLEPHLLNQPFTGFPKFLHVKPNNQFPQTNSTWISNSCV